MLSRMRYVIMTALVVALASIGMTAQAQLRTNDREMRQLIRRIENGTDRFRTSFSAALDNSTYNNTATEDEANRYVQDFEAATNRLRDRFENRQAVAADAQEVLNRAATINNFMLNNRFGTRADSDWAALRTDLNTLATNYSVSWSWDNQNNRPGNGRGRGRGNNRDDSQLISRLETGAARFSQSISYALSRGSYSAADRQGYMEYVSAFQSAISRLRNRYVSRQAGGSDVQEVLDRARAIDDFMQRNRTDSRAQSDWAALRTDLNTLATNYSVSWNWGNQGYPSNTGTIPVDTGVGYTTNSLTGTYRLDASRSDDARRAAERATTSISYRDRQRVLDALTARLEAPSMLAIERSGRNVTIASSRAQQIAFEADGRERVEQTQSGRSISTRADLRGDQLFISTSGDSGNDFSVTFDPIDNGSRLRVVRRVSVVGLNQPVEVQSVYERTSAVAQWNIYTGAGYSNYPSNTTASGDFIIPNNTQLVAVLNNNLSTRQASEGERFTMTVREPSQFDGATIEGYVSNVSRSGRVSGRSGMTLSFESIRLRNGQTYRFSGFVETVRTANGETVRVDNEGGVRDSDNQTSRTVQRTAIGSAVGAIIGAIAGGGKGAAIGAAVGAGAGAGSVYVQGRDDLELLSGTEVTIRASAPR